MDLRSPVRQWRSTTPGSRLRRHARPRRHPRHRAPGKHLLPAPPPRAPTSSARRPTASRATTFTLTVNRGTTVTQRWTGHPPAASGYVACSRTRRTSSAPSTTRRLAHPARALCYRRPVPRRPASFAPPRASPRAGAAACAARRRSARSTPTAPPASTARSTTSASRGCAEDRDCEAAASATPTAAADAEGRRGPRRSRPDAAPDAAPDLPSLPTPSPTRRPPPDT